MSRKSCLITSNFADSVSILILYYGIFMEEEANMMKQDLKISLPVYKIGILTLSAKMSDLAMPAEAV